MPIVNGAKHHKKAHAQQTLAELIDPHIVEGTQPDAWMATHVLQAIGAIAAQMYDLAAVLADKAQVDPSEHVALDPDLPVPTAQQLRHALGVVEVLPAPNF